jgi:hypothetical protein
MRSDFSVTLKAECPSSGYNPVLYSVCLEFESWPRDRLYLIFCEFNLIQPGKVLM